MINQNVLALDLATKTGWAIRLRDGTVKYGVFGAKSNKGAHGGQRFINFRQSLSDLIEKYDVHHIAYEDVRNHTGIIAAHIHGGIKAVMMMTCAYRNIGLSFEGVGAIKRHWVGKGRASKEEMIAEAVKRGYRPEDDNVADALALLSLVFADSGVAL